MTGIFYGSTTGATEQVASDIAQQLGVEAGDIHNVGESSADDVEAYDVLLLGSSTWGAGDLQDDWYDFLDNLKGKDLTGKKVGLFGCGDSGSYPDTFCGALGQIYDALQGTGATFIGAYAPEDYDVTDSDVCRDGEFVGLAIDESEPEKSDARTAKWCQLIKEA
ncbi:MAG: flavodoxin [Bacteroidales bacterium]|nr:flavodoxin [Bacteroidales bacterium]